MPFYVADIRTIKCPIDLYNQMIKNNELPKNADFASIEEIVRKWASKVNQYELADEFLIELKQQFKHIAANRYSPFQDLYDHAVLRTKTGFYGLSQLLEQFKQGDSEFISGEESAFTALTSAVKLANESLFTTRFANQSIVSNPKKCRKDFTDALYSVSKVLNSCERIICNNAPEKWKDIYYALVHGGKNMKVFVRAYCFSTHFELVIVDDKIAFIHFYDKSMDGTQQRKSTHSEIKRVSVNGQFLEQQTINSTLRLQGPVCKKLASIFKRLHHKDYLTFFHTILGVDDGNDSDNDDGSLYSKGVVGVFQLPDNYEDSDNSNAKKRRDAFELLINAYKHWCDKTKESFLTQSFTAEDAWIMYYGLKSLGDELHWESDICVPQITCPASVELLIKNNSI